MKLCGDTDNIANVGNAVVVIMLYMFVLKSLMLSLRNTARRTEYMLLGFPEDFAGEGPLKRFFMRANLQRVPGIIYDTRHPRKNDGYRIRYPSLIIT